MTTSRGPLSSSTPPSGPPVSRGAGDGVPFTEVIDGRAGRIRAHGHLDVRAADMLDGAVTALQGSGHARILLDLEGVRAADDAGLNALRSVKDRVTEAGGQLILLHQPRPSAD